MLNVVIDNVTYPVQKIGQGPIACLCIGLGNLLLRSLSDNFKEMFTLYATDLYFTVEYKHPSAQSFTMTALSSHVAEIIHQLHLEKPILMAHSCFGILALEIAKYHHADLGGVILIASAPQWNNASIAFTDKYFKEHAELERIENDHLRKQKYALIKKPFDSEVSIDKYIADSARYWGDFTISEEAIHLLWKDIQVDDVIINQFFEHILPNHNLSIDIEKVKVPILLLAGERDYDSLPLIQWENFPKPRAFTVINCGDVGHWPQLESQQIFDKSVREWINRIYQF